MVEVDFQQVQRALFSNDPDYSTIGYMVTFSNSFRVCVLYGLGAPVIG